MPALKIILDDAEFAALERRAEAERRPISSQASVLIREGLGLAFPIDLEGVKSQAEKYAKSRNDSSRSC